MPDPALGGCWTKAGWPELAVRLAVIIVFMMMFVCQAVQFRFDVVVISHTVH